MAARNGKNKDLRFKVLVIGDVAVGKTCLANRIVSGEFSDEYRATLGVDFLIKTYENYRPGLDVTLMIWDTAGQERFQSMTRVYYAQAHGAAIIYAAPQAETVNSVAAWKQKVDEALDGQLPTIAIANKCDLEHEEMSADASKAFESDMGLAGHFYASAKDGTGYEEAVACLVDAMLVEALGDEADGDGGDGGLEGDPGTIRITRDHGDSSKKCAC